MRSAWSTNGSRFRVARVGSVAAANRATPIPSRPLPIRPSGARLRTRCPRGAPKEWCCAWSALDGRRESVHRGKHQWQRGCDRTWLHRAEHRNQPRPRATPEPRRHPLKSKQADLRHKDSACYANTRNSAPTLDWHRWRCQSISPTRFRRLTGRDNREFRCRRQSTAETKSAAHRATVDATKV